MICVSNNKLVNSNSQLRKSMIQQRKTLSPEQIKALSHCICEKIICSKEYYQVENIMVYYPMEHEVDIKEFIDHAWNQKKTIAFPKIISKHIMSFYIVDRYEQLKAGKFNIKEPVEGCTVFIPTKPTLMIVPGTAFAPSSKGIARIGYGGGYYDYYLNQYKSKIISYGVGFDFQVKNEDQIVMASHDQYIDRLITPSNIFY